MARKRRDGERHGLLLLLLPSTHLVSLFALLLLFHSNLRSCAAPLCSLLFSTFRLPPLRPSPATITLAASSPSSSLASASISAFPSPSGRRGREEGQNTGGGGFLPLGTKGQLVVGGLSVRGGPLIIKLAARSPWLPFPPSASQSSSRTEKGS